MNSLADMFRMGGPAMYAVLLLTILGMVSTAVLGIVGLFGKRIPLPVWLLIPSSIVAAGLAGMVLGVTEVNEALAYATSETRSKLFIRGMSLAAAPLWFACLSASGILGLSSAAAGAGALSKLGKREWTPISAVVATLGSLAGLAVIFVGGAMMDVGPTIIFGGLTLALVALGSLLSNLSTGDEDVRPRVASIRLGVAFMGALAAFCWGIGAHHFILAEVFEAIEVATPETRMRLLAHGIEASSAASTLGGISAAVVVVMGALANATHTPRAFDARGIVGGAIGLLFASVMFGANAIYDSLASDGSAAAVPSRAIELASKTSLPPQPEDHKLTREPDPSCIVRREGEKWTLTSGWPEGQPDGCSSEQDRGSGLEDRFVQLEVSEEEPDRVLSKARGEGCPSRSGPLEGPLCDDIKVTLALDASDPVASFMQYPWTSGGVRDFNVLLQPSEFDLHGNSLISEALRWSSYRAMPIRWMKLSSEPPKVTTDEGSFAATLSVGKSDYDDLIVVRRTESGWSLQTSKGKAEVEAKGLRTALERAGFDSSAMTSLVPDPSWSVGRTIEVCAEVVQQIPRKNDPYSYGRQEALRCILLAMSDEEIAKVLKPSTPEAVEAVGATFDGDMKMVGGKLSEDQVSSALAKKQSAISRCHQRALAKDPGASGEVQVIFTIGTAGRVTAIKPTVDKVGHGVGDCVAGEIKRLRFPRPSGGAVTVSKKFSFDASPGKKPTKVTASTSGGAPAVMGSLDKNIIRRVVRQHRNEIRYCYEKELVKNPNLGGKVDVKFTVSPTGSVASAAVASSTLNNASVESCITKKIKRWKFPQPKGGGIVVVKYPFNFSTK